MSVKIVPSIITMRVHTERVITPLARLFYNRPMVKKSSIEVSTSSSLLDSRSSMSETLLIRQMVRSLLCQLTRIIMYMD